MIPDRLKYVFGTFLGRPRMWPNLDHRTPHFSPKYFKKYKKIMGASLNILFSYLRIWNYENVGRYVCLTFWNLKSWNFEKWKCWTCQIWTFVKLKIKIFVSRKFGNMGLTKFENWELEIETFYNFEMLWRWAPEMMKIPVKKSSNSWIWISYLPKKHEMEIW